VPIAFDKTLGTASLNAGQATLPLTTSAAAVSGSRIFLIVEWAGAQTLSSVAGGGLTWQVDKQDVATGAIAQRLGIASADAPAGLASSTVITATFSASTTVGLIAACSATGLAAAVADATHSTPAGAPTANWTDTVTTVAADTFVLGASAFDCTASPTNSPTNGTEVHDFFNNSFAGSMASQYRIESTAGAKQVNGTWSNTTGATGNIVVTAAYAAAVSVSAPGLRRFPLGV
jgi:hypothetical protein